MIQRFHGIERHKKFSTISVLNRGPENWTFTGQWRRLNLEDDYWRDCKGNR